MSTSGYHFDHVNWAATSLGKLPNAFSLNPDGREAVYDFDPKTSEAQHCAGCRCEDKPETT